MVAALILFGAWYYVNKPTLTEGPVVAEPISVASRDNVSLVDGKQIITITARGGYSPRLTIAKADIPTVLKVETKGTFDCSAALSIRSLNYYKVLGPNEVTTIDLPPQKPGSTFQGLCAMGMYNFEIQFE